MIGKAPPSKSTGVPGWHTVTEEHALIALAQQYVRSGGIIVELGGEYGRSAAEFGFACKDLQDIRIFSVDLFPDDHYIASKHGGLLIVWQTNLNETGLPQRGNLSFIPVQSDTAQAGKNWTHGDIDLLFVDAAHDYAGAKRDIDAWCDHVRTGGVVIFHDYANDPNAHYLHHEVKQVVDEWHAANSADWHKIALPDSLIAFERVAKKEAVHAPQNALATADQVDQAPAKKRPSRRKSGKKS